MNIIPSILVKNASEFKSQIKAIEKHTDIIQLDIADGTFVDNTTWADPEIVKKYCKTNIELHLMVSDPLQELKKWATVDQVIRFYVHFESVKNLGDIMPLHAYGWEIGIAINPETDIKQIEKYLPEIKAVLFLSIHPGKQGRKLMPEVLQKITDFKQHYPAIFTAIDGGVKDTNILQVQASGVDAASIGSDLFHNDEKPAKNLKKLKKIINN